MKDQQPLDVAIVGTGIAGMVAARLISLRHKVTVYESASRLGGHTNTVDVATARGTVPVDTGFIVFNERTYPNFCRILSALGVASKSSDMCFSVRSDKDRLEWGTTDLRSVFAQPRNLLRPRFYRMLMELRRFHEEASRLPGSGDKRTLGEFLTAGGYSQTFRDWFLLPMTAAIWSTAPSRMEDFPVEVLARFMANHGLLSVSGAPTWRVIENGSRSYIDALMGPLASSTQLNSPVRSVRRNQTVEITLESGQQKEHQAVVLALHSDQALSILADPGRAESEVLAAMGYQPNHAVLHTDESLMPRHRQAWSSWNVHSNDGSAPVALTYWMNRLQGLSCPEQFFVTLNGQESIDPSKVLRTFTYHHPLFDQAAIAAQSRWEEISAHRNTHYCGAYWGYGFHEDGVNSALRVARSLGVTLEDFEQATSEPLSYAA